MPTDASHDAPTADAPTSAVTPASTDASEDLPTAPPADPVGDAMREWQRALAAHGGPNSLLWYDDEQLAVELTRAHPGGLAMLLSHRPTTLSDMVREKSAFAEALQRVQALRDKAEELREEHGLSGLYLAGGIVHLPVGQRTLAAPLLLRTVELVPVDPAGRDVQIVVGDGIEINHALVDLLRRLKIRVDPDAVAAKARTRSGFDLSPAVRELMAQVGDVEGFSVDRRLIISTFTYAKGDLGADLAEHTREWSRERLVRLLAGERPDTEPTLPERDADGDLAAERPVLDLDAAQTHVVEAVRAGTDVVLDAPATTGGTQVIAATVAAVAGDGRTGLVVASSRQALTDVVDRLDAAGLRDLVVHADDDPRTRRRAIEEVLASLDAQVPAAQAPDVRHLTDLRERLAGHHEALHRRRDPWGVSAAEAQSAIATLTDVPRPPTSRIRLDPDTLARTNRTRATAVGRVLAQAAERGAWRGGSGDDPWFGARLTSAEEAKAAGLVLRRLLGPDGLERAEARVRDMCAAARLTPSDTLPGWRGDVDLVTGVRDTTAVFTQDVYDAPLPEMLAATSSVHRAAHGPQIGLWRRWSRRRQAKALLLPGVVPPDLHAALTAAREQARAWRDRCGPAARPHPAPGLDDARAAVDGVRADIAWLATRLQGTAAGDGIEGLPVPRLREHLEQLARRLDRAGAVPTVIGVLDGARGAGFGALVDDLARRDLPADRVAAEVEFVWWSSVLDAIRAGDPGYGEHDAASWRRLHEQYVRADREYVQAGAAYVRAAVSRRARAVAAENPRQVAVLRAELERPEMPRPLAQVWADAPDVVAAARPVWAVSPGALAGVVPASVTFGVVAVDGAQSLVPALGAGALARARTALVVGDAQGIPPMPYRTTAGGASIDDDIDLVRGGRSLFDAMAGRLAPARLRVAYGRPDPRLDAVTGSRDLLHAPTPGGPSPVVIERVSPPQHTDLVSPDAEVERVARLVLAHARGRRTRSLGVVTVTSVHADRILDCVRAEIDRLGPESAEAKGLADLPEPLFVVPVHRLAGRTRDIILFSPGFGVGNEGASARRFGIISLPGGERLITAAASSARTNLALVTSLTTSELGLARAPIDGVARLRALLVDVETAQDTVSAQVDAAGRTPDDPVLGGLARRLRAAGLQVRPDLGQPGRVIDLAVTRPGTTGSRPVAVLTDADTLGGLRGIRERARLWPAVLERRGWSPLPVSLIDLFVAPAPEATRVAAAVDGQ